MVFGHGSDECASDLGGFWFLATSGPCHRESCALLEPTWYVARSCRTPMRRRCRRVCQELPLLRGSQSLARCPRLRVLSDGTASVVRRLWRRCEGLLRRCAKVVLIGWSCWMSRPRASCKRSLVPRLQSTRRRWRRYSYDWRRKKNAKALRSRRGLDAWQTRFYATASRWRGFLSTLSAKDSACWLPGCD